MLSQRVNTSYNMAINLQLVALECGGDSMAVGAIIAILFIFGLFLSMLSSSPKAEVESHPDTEV
jgi:hypothetical protein